MRRLALHWQILIALLLDAVAGQLTGEDTTLLGVPLLGAYEFVGTLFLNALKMQIVPLIVFIPVCCRALQAFEEPQAVLVIRQPLLQQ